MNTDTPRLTKLAAATLAAALALAATGCTPAFGKVAGKPKPHKAHWSLVATCKSEHDPCARKDSSWKWKAGSYRLTIKDEDGNQGDLKVPWWGYNRCNTGDQYPGCMYEAS
ncbi:hypothetical protein [Microbispora sp. NPDC049125]|uniref:hypothetical protein n=1 Tax=Microbispora sp. NPDC049125 TaxID=3154929 RepID=UPI0034670A3C